MKVTIKGVVHLRNKHYGDDDKYEFHDRDVSHIECLDVVAIGPAEFEYEVPDDFNPIPGQVAALNKQLDTLADEYHSKVAQIKGRINDLLCLEAPKLEVEQ